MEEIQLQKPLDFGINPKQITRKINLVQIKSDTHNLRSDSKNSKSKKRVCESPYKKQTLT